MDSLEPSIPSTPFAGVPFKGSELFPLERLPLRETADPELSRLPRSCVMIIGGKVTRLLPSIVLPCSGDAESVDNFFGDSVGDFFAAFELRRLRW